jgi:hypothetical protein
LLTSPPPPAAAPPRRRRRRPLPPRVPRRTRCRGGEGGVRDGQKCCRDRPGPSHPAQAPPAVARAPDSLDRHCSRDDPRRRNGTTTQRAAFPCYANYRSHAQSRCAYPLSHDTPLLARPTFTFVTSPPPPPPPPPPPYPPPPVAAPSSRRASVTLSRRRGRYYKHKISGCESGHSPPTGQCTYKWHRHRCTTRLRAAATDGASAYDGSPDAQRKQPPPPVR